MNTRKILCYPAHITDKPGHGMYVAGTLPQRRGRIVGISLNDSGDAGNIIPCDRSGAVNSFV